VVLGEPARPADALDHEVTRLAVERGEMSTVARRHPDAGDGADVETRLIEHHHDMRWLAGRTTDLAARRQPEIVHQPAVGLEPAVLEIPGDRARARAGELGDVFAADEIVVWIFGGRDRQPGETREAGGKAQRGARRARAERVEPPDQGE